MSLCFKKRNVEIVEIPLTSINLSERNRRSLQSHSSKIDEIRKAFEEEIEIPPIKLNKSGDGSFDIKDGRHRFLAAEAAGLTFIDAIVV